MRTRIFNEEELELLATPLSIRLERAAKARDTRAIDEIRWQMDLECTAVYDKQSVWTGALQTFIVQHAGEVAHDEALRGASDHAFRPSVFAYRNLDFPGRVVALARRLRASGSTFWVVDEGERIRFRMDPWGSARLWRQPPDWQREEPRRRDGSRIVYASQGAYEPEVGLAFLRGARPITHGRDVMPCFFATEILYYEVQPIELLGMPLATVTLPADSTSPAYLDVYKDPGAIPANVYERLGYMEPRGGLPAPAQGHVFSPDELDRLGTPLSLQVEAAAAACDWDLLLEIAASMDVELVAAKDPLNLLNLGLLTWIARQLGEGEAERALERSAEVVMGPAVEAVKDLDIASALRQFAMVWRAHGSTFWIEETEDAFVMRGRPMGACGRMWAHAYQPEIERVSNSRVRYTTWGAYDPPASFHVMREPRPTTCGKVGMPIYSAHCHMFHEIFPIHRIGRPLWIEEHPIGDNDGETVHVHYKDYEAWPDEYYTRVGLERPARRG